MYKFYACQDHQKDGTFDFDYLLSVLSFRELVRFGYQQNITPNLISPDDMVYIYKNLVREQSDSGVKSGPGRSNTMIDFEGFKKAIVRISVMAQEKVMNGQTSRESL